MAEESQPETLLLRATEEPSSVHSVLMVLGKLLFAVLAVAGIVIGIVYFSQCPRQPPLPVYVVILGTVTLLLLFLSCIPCGDGTNRPSTLLSCFRAAGFLFLCAWFIAGNVWVYSIYPPDYEAVGQPDFCQRTLFLFAFGVTTAIHVALAVALLLALGILAVILILNTIMSYDRHSCPGAPARAAFARSEGEAPLIRAGLGRASTPQPGEATGPGARGSAGSLPPRAGPGASLQPGQAGAARRRTETPLAGGTAGPRASRKSGVERGRLDPESASLPQLRAGHGGGGGGGPHAGPGAHPGPDRLPGHLRRRRPGVGRRPGERRAHGGRDRGAGEHGLRLPAAARAGGALPPRLSGLRGTLLPGDRLRPETLRGEAAQQRPGARDRLSGPRGDFVSGGEGREPHLQPLFRPFLAPGGACRTSRPEAEQPPSSEGPAPALCPGPPSFLPPVTPKLPHNDAEKVC